MVCDCANAAEDDDESPGNAGLDRPRFDAGALTFSEDEGLAVDDDDDDDDDADPLPVALDPWNERKYFNCIVSAPISCMILLYYFYE